MSTTTTVELTPAADDVDHGAHAMTYIGWGWKVFPLWWVRSDGRCACPKRAACQSPGKHPLVRHGVLEASRDQATVGGWWYQWPRANIGLPAGDNGLAVLDIDPRHGGAVSLRRLQLALQATGEPLPDTLRSVTGSRGEHLVFGAPPGGIINAANPMAAMPGIDTRGRGGYIVAPPSRHASGRRYEWAEHFWFTPIAAWPQSLSELMCTPRPVVPATLNETLRVSDRYAAAALAGEVARMREAPEGTRNHTLNRAAFSLGQLAAAGLLDEDLVTSELGRAALAAGLGPAEIRATLRSGLRGGATKPRAGVAAL